MLFAVNSQENDDFHETRGLGYLQLLHIDFRRKVA